MEKNVQPDKPTADQPIDISELWQLQISLANYAPDTADTPTILFRDFQRNISIDEYLDEIYVTRDIEHYETILAQEIKRTGRVLCIAGERGAGKTSAILWARRYLSDNDPSLRCELIDIRRSYDSLDLSYLEECTMPAAEFTLRLEQSFKKMVRNTLMQRLFPTSDDYLKLVAWGVSGPPDDSQKFDSVVTEDLLDFYGEAIGYARWDTQLNRQQRQNHLLALFKEDPVTFEKIRSKLWDCLHVKHMIHAYLCCSSVHDRVILVLDNIDRIPMDHQPHFLSAARDIQLSCGSKTSTAIAVRTENARGIYMLPGDELFVDVILLDDVRYTGLLLPSLEHVHAKKVLEVREHFARKVLTEYDSRNGSSWYGIQSERVHPYHSSVVAEFEDDQVHALSNDSCRSLLTMYGEFMRYIWKASERTDNEGKALLDLQLLKEDADEKHIQTLFFLWLHQCGHDVGIPLQNIVEHDFDESAIRFADAASPQYLLLTCIYSQREELKAQGFANPWPAWSDVVKRLRDLGFSYSSIQSAANSFLSPIGEPAGMLRFAYREVGATKLQEVSREPVILTKLGMEVVANVIYKVGYIWGVARRRVGAEDSVIGYYNCNAIGRARHIYAFAKHLAREHLRVLQLLGSEWKYLYGETWPDVYRRQFGVSMKLQCEAILDSAASFYAHLFHADTDTKNPFRTLRHAYSSLFKKLGTKKISADDLKRLDAGDAIVDNLRFMRR